MKVLLSDTWGGGGASTFVATLAHGLTSRGHTVDVVVGYRDSPAVAEYAGIVRRVYLPPVDFNGLALAGDYDVLHVTEDDLCPPFDYARRIRRMGLRARVVVTLHQEHSVVRSDVDEIVYVSDASRRRAVSMASSTVVPNGVNVGLLLAQASGAPAVEGEGPLAVWVGRVDDPLDQKDFRGFGYAMRSLTDKGWRILVLDGSPPSKEHPAREQLRRWFGDRVAYANQVPRATVLGALAHAGKSGGALVSTSRYEAAPFIALEALAVGCPVVAPRISGYQALLDAGAVTGYEGLDGLIELLTSGDFRTRSPELPPQLSAEHMVGRYLEIYERDPRVPRQELRHRAARLAVRMIAYPPVGRLRDAVRRVSG